MKKTTKFSLTLLASFMIVACSGGSNSGSGAEKTNKPMPKVESPKVESPKVESPKVESSKVESPKVESPKVESPKVESPKVESPKVESPKVESPKVESPKVESPKVESSKVESPKVESSKVESPKVESPKVESPKVESPKIDKTGVAYLVNGMDYSRKELNNAENINSIIVDNKTLPISQLEEDIAFSFFNKIGIENVRFGRAENKDSNGEHGYFYFYNGKPTQDLPTSGTAQYKGYFSVKGISLPDSPSDHQFGHANVNVDFSNKQVIGDLSMISPNKEKLLMKANIEGSHFVGKINSTEVNVNAEVEGGFYGENASELGGIFTDKKSVIGVIGAKVSN